MSLEGLQVILDKEEIVATQRADDLLDRPGVVDETYQRHVRTYVPLGRQSTGGSDQSVTRFERKVISEVKKAGAIRGYITAEYGHGKTSTGLYLWQQARKNNLLAVPPFQLNKLSDFIRATFGWVRYEINRTRPNSSTLQDAEQFYNTLIKRGAKSWAKQYDISLPAAERIVQERPEVLELNPKDYIQFFERMTALALESGFDGLLIIADELQQYIDPEIKAGIKDPVSPLFDVISAILTRRNQLEFGLIVVIPPKELGVLRDYRGDLIHRLLQVSLDLRTVYDQEFPMRLWKNLAQEHQFENHATRIISNECLVSLGQIGVRPDLSDGPRTVVNTFRRATRRYIEAGYPHDDPYTPKTLVDDLMQGRIQYDSSKRIAQVTARTLEHTLVKGYSQRETAVKWAAAFPNEGVPRDWQQRLNLTEAFDELIQNALGDLVISVGDVRSQGITLRGLEEAPIETDWLSITVREFWRSYVETSDKTRQRVIQGFIGLLKTSVFPNNQWDVIEETPERYTQNAGILFQGAYTGMRQRFPDRMVHVRLLWEDDTVKDAGTKGDVLIQIRLRRYLDKLESERRSHAEPLHIDFENRCIDITLNLMGRSVEISPQLERAIGPIVSPYKLTPLLLLSLYQVMEEHRQRNGIPRTEDQQIEHMFQPDLLDSAFRELYSSTVGKPVGAAQERVVELALQQLLEAMYPSYTPLVVVGNWTSSLQKYRNALGNLDSNYERQGQIVTEGTKTNIAKLFPLSNTGLDSFARSFPSLIEGVGKLPGSAEGNVRFTLHPLEKDIRKWLQESEREETVKAGDKSTKVHALPQHQIYENARSLGYLEKETDSILELMDVRGLTELDKRRGLLRESVTLAPSVDELEGIVKEWLGDIQSLRSVFSADPQLRDWEEMAKKVDLHLNEQLRKRPDDTELYRRKRGVQELRHQLDLYAIGKHQQQKKNAQNLLEQIPTLEQQLKKRLNSQVQGAVEYIDQVNTQLRVSLLRQFSKLESDIAQLHQYIQGVKAALQVESLDIPTLIRLFTEIDKYRPMLSDMKERHQRFMTHYREYAQWVDLVEDGTRLTDELQQFGELVQEQHQTFQQLSNEIRGHLSAKKLDALPDAPTYSIRLNEISEQVRQLRADATDKFTKLQDRYRQTLVKRLDFPQEHLWNPHRYNPVAPREIYSRLYDEVQRTVQLGICDKFRKIIDAELESVNNTLTSSLIKELPSDIQSSLQQRGKELEIDLSKLKQRLSAVRRTADDAAAIADFPENGEGTFQRILEELSSVKNDVVKLKYQVGELSSTLRKLELTMPEDMALVSLQGTPGPIDLGELRQSAEKLSDVDFWQAISGLHAKRRIRIVVERIRYD